MDTVSQKIESAKIQELKKMFDEGKINWIRLSHGKKGYLLMFATDDNSYCLYTERNTERYFKSADTALSLLSSVGVEEITVENVDGITRQIASPKESAAGV